MTHDTLLDVLEQDYALLRGLKPKALSQFRLTLARFRELIVATRPDCVDATVADLLAGRAVDLVVVDEHLVQRFQVQRIVVNYQDFTVLVHLCLSLLD